MTRPHPAAFSQNGYVRVALLTALLIGLCGLYPHLRWSLELNHVAWFYNSYDEGYYGWLSFSGFGANRLLSDLVMHGLHVGSGSNAQAAMIMADFFLPFFATLACCYMVRPIFGRPIAMAAGALFVLVSAECLALRSTSIPHSPLYALLQEKVLPLFGGPAGIFQIGNQTSTFWLFRTPEPQVSWTVMFLTLGLGLRLVAPGAQPSPRPGLFLLLAAIAGTGYLFCALCLGGTFLLFAVLAGRSYPRQALVVGAGGLMCVLLCLGLSFYSARQSGGDSFVFPSNRPVVMLSTMLGLLAVVLTLLRCFGQKQLSPVHLFAVALGLTPLCMANQQLVTGRMIYLLNFENFGFPQLSALALLLPIGLLAEVKPTPGNAPTKQPLNPRRSFPAMLIFIILGWIIGRSQLLSYTQYLETNRLAKSYALTLQSIVTHGEVIVCDDFFQTDTLALMMGYRPELLLARDMTFTTPIGRLRNAAEAPANSARPKQALFAYLALTGASPDDFSRRFAAITDPDNSNWQDRFMLGGFLYNYTDFWAPLTHGRDTKISWIEGQKPLIVAEYRQFLGGGKIGSRSVIYIMQRDKSAPLFTDNYHAQIITLPPAHTPLPMKAYRIATSPSP